MSGHSGFIQLGGNIPNNVGNVGNVDNVQQPGNVNPQPPNIDGEEPPEAAPDKISPRELSRQLDVLLVQAAKVSTKGIDAEALKGQVRELGLPKKELQKLVKLIDNAGTTLAALDKFTGRELAAATSMEINNTGEDSEWGRYEDVWDTKTAAGKAIQAALDAQAALSEKLVSLVNNCKGLSDEAKEMLDSAAMVCDRRSCEIETLTMQFSQAVSRIRNGDINTLDAAVRDRLDTKLFALMGEKAASMHGNAEALAKMRGRLAPLAKRLDDFTSKPDGNIASEAFASMRLELADAKEALATLARDGYKVGESRVLPDKEFMDAAKGILAQVEKRMEGARQKLAEAAIGSYVDSVFAPPKGVGIMDEKFRPLLRIVANGIAKMAAEKKAILAAAREYAKNPSQANRDALDEAILDYNSLPSARGAKNDTKKLAITAEMLLFNDATELKARIDKAKPKLSPADQEKITPQLVEEFRKALEEFAAKGENGPQPKAVAKFLTSGGRFQTQIAHLDDMRKTIDRMADVDFLTSKTFLGAFEGEIAPSTLVEVRAHGMQDEDLDPATEQANVENSEVLGSGNINTVTAVTFKNGETRVFKPEAPGREALEGAPYLYEGYGKEQQVAKLNMATQKTADALGLGDVMTKTSVGKHNGHYGIFMEKAKGKSAFQFANNQKMGKGSLRCGDVKRLPVAEHAKVQGQLMRKCNRLDWFDVLTGQADRHNGNVMVNVANDGKVDLKGIDNDTCYPPFRIGMAKYVVAGRHLDIFNQLLDFVTGLYPRVPAKDARQWLLDDPGVTDNGNGTFTLDATKFKAPELCFCLKMTFGVYSTYVPNVIDKELYDQLQTLKEGRQEREAYIADLSKRLSKPALDAAIMRLDDTIRHADELQKKGMVYSEADWENRDKQKAVVNDENDQKPEFGKRFGTYPYRQMKGFGEIELAIDDITQGNYKRQCFILSAKDGWFD